MDEKISAQLDTLEKKLEQVEVSVEKVRKYMLWSLISGIALFVLPLIALAFAVPYFLKTYLSVLNSF